MAKLSRRDASKERFWRSMLRRWRGSGLSVRDFCAAEELSEASFFAWRRELARREQEMRPPVVTAAAVQIAAAQTEGGNRARRQGRSLFVPVQVRAAGTAVGAAADTPGTGIEIVLLDGTRLRVAARFDGDVLRRVLAVLGGSAGQSRECERQGGEPC